MHRLELAQDDSWRPPTLPTHKTQNHTWRTFTGAPLDPTSRSEQLLAWLGLGPEAHINTHTPMDEWSEECNYLPFDRWERHYCTYKEAWLFHHSGAWQAPRTPHYPTSATWHRLPDEALQPLSCHGWHPGNFLQNREATRARPLILPPSLADRPAAKILERHHIPTIMEHLGTRPSWHGCILKQSTSSALLPISARVVTGFNQRKLPGRTIATLVYISKVFDIVSYCLWGSWQAPNKWPLCPTSEQRLVASPSGHTWNCILNIFMQAPSNPVTSLSPPLSWSFSTQGNTPGLWPRVRVDDPNQEWKNHVFFT